MRSNISNDTELHISTLFSHHSLLQRKNNCSKIFYRVKVINIILIFSELKYHIYGLMCHNPNVICDKWHHQQQLPVSEAI